MDNKSATPLLFPVEPDEFLEKIRTVLKEEIRKALREKPGGDLQTVDGLVQKPLYKIDELCSFFQVSKPTVYEWIKCGKLKPYKVRSRVYFLHSDIEKLLHP